MREELLEYIEVAKKGDIPAGEGRTYRVRDTLIALFFDKESYFAIEDHCPHMGASLGAGFLEEDGTVLCPWHAWRFNICDGTWCDNPKLKVKSYPVRIEGNAIAVGFPKESQHQSDSIGQQKNQPPKTES